MAPEGVDEAGDDSDRVARGFEALVDEEALFPSTPPVIKPPPPRPNGGGPAGAGDGTAVATPAADAAPKYDDGRLDRLEERVRQTMDRLTELVEAQLPEAVDGLRADLETLRLELQTTLEQARGEMEEERKQLRAQIATTVGAANRWFVRTRDQLYERLDHIAEIADDTRSQAEVAASAAAAVGALPPAPGEAPASAVPASPSSSPARQVETPDLDDVSVEWEVEGGLTPVSVARAALPEVGVFMAPVRNDIQQLQAEVGELRATVDRLERRMARTKPVRLEASQIELIVEAVSLAATTFPVARSRAAAPRSPRATAAPKATKATKTTKATKATKATAATTAARAPRATRATRTVKAAAAVAPPATRARATKKQADSSRSPRTPYKSFI